MKTYVDYNYGADVDGNRGYTVIDAELTEDDADEVREQIRDQFEPDTTFYTVFMEDERGNEFEFEDEDILNWFTPEEVKEMQKECE